MVTIAASNRRLFVLLKRSYSFGCQTELILQMAYVVNDSCALE